MRMFAIAATLALVASVTAVQAQERTPSPHGAKVYFENLKDGAKVTSPVTVKFGIKGMTLAQAGRRGLRRAVHGRAIAAVTSVSRGDRPRHTHALRIVVDGPDPIGELVDLSCAWSAPARSRRAPADSPSTAPATGRARPAG